MDWCVIKRQIIQKISPSVFDGKLVTLTDRAVQESVTLSWWKQDSKTKFMTMFSKRLLLLLVQRILVRDVMNPGVLESDGMSMSAIV